MSVEISNNIVRRNAPLIFPPVNKDDNTDRDESDAIVPITTDGAYPGEFTGAGTWEFEHVEEKNPAYTQLPSLEGDYASVGIDSFVRVQPDTGGEQGLRDNVPYTTGPVSGGGTSLGTSWMDGRTLRIRRPAESSIGPVGANDYASSLQYSLMQSQADMAIDEASRAAIVAAV